MAEASSTNGKLYTLTEVSKRTKISMPTLQRYKKMFNDRIPSSGDGRSQRYPETAIEIFNQLKVENSKKRGRPRKNAAQGAGPAAPRPAKAAAPKAVAKPAAEEVVEPGMLSLKDVEDQTGISYPTLLRYLKTSLKRIPHKGSGRRRRFPQEAVAVFKTLKEESRRGRKAGSGKAAAAKPAAPPAAKTKAAAAKPAAPAKADKGKDKDKGKAKGKAPAAAAPAPAAAPKKRGRPPKNPAAVAAAAPAQAADSGLAAQVRELGKTIAALQKQVNRLEAELQKPFKVMLKR